MIRMGTHRPGKWALTPLLAAVAVGLAALGFAAPAFAGKPKAPYENFSQCPTKTSGVNFCVFGQTTSGEFKIKSTEVPITKTITLQGGIIENLETGAETFVNAANGETVSKTPQTVPGGLFKIIAPKEWPEILQILFNEFIDKGITGVNATSELVGNVTINRENLFEETGTAIGLPLRVHLENSFLGSSCYVGSKANPVQVNLTTGTTSPPLPNEPISGSVGEFELLEDGNLVILKKNELVNNTFSAPSAEGCGSEILFGLFTGLIDEAVDSELGLPSASGNNTAILKGTLENASAAAVVKSE